MISKRTNLEAYREGLQKKQDYESLIHARNNPYGYLIAINSPFVNKHWETWCKAWNNATVLEPFKKWEIKLSKRTVITERIWDYTERRKLFEKVFMESTLYRKQAKKERETLGQLGYEAAMKGLEIGKTILGEVPA